MTYLLDTHFVIWAITDTQKISRDIQNIIADPEHTILVSAVSFWEVSLKSAIGKLKLAGVTPIDLPTHCVAMGFELIDLSAEESCSYHQLTAEHHKDPFDRMLIWQAIRNGYVLISVDKNVKKYKSAGLKVLG